MNPMPEDPNADRALDALLAADVVPAPSPALRRTILLDFEQRMAGGFWRSFWHELGGVRVVAPALTASLALGIAVATFAPPATEATVDEEAPGYPELALLDGAYEDYLP